MQGANHPDIHLLRRIRSLSQFDDGQLQKLATTLHIETATAGSCLVELGSTENSSLYLVQGALQGSTHDRQQIRFNGSEDGEIYPVAGIRPSMYRIVAEDEARFIKLYPEQLGEFARREIDPEPAEGADPFAIDDTAEQSMFEIQLFNDLLAGNLVLPSLPDVAQRIQQAYADNLVTPGTVGVIIQSDPVITAKMIMVANSALYRGHAAIESLQQAVVRLGLENTRKLVMSYVVKDLFNSKTSAMKTQMQAAWKNSVHVASLSRLLADRLDRFDVEQAQLAGLVHGIGEVAILQYAQQNDELRNDPVRLRQAVVTLRPQVTGMLLQEWNFAPDMVDVGQQCGDWFRNPADTPDLCDLVLIARYHAMIGSAEQKNLPPIAALPAFAKLGMGGLAIDEILEFLKKSRDKIRMIEAHLGSL